MPIKADWHLLSEAKLAPDDSGVYELGYARNGLVIYIGSSEVSIRSRLLKHVQRKDFVGVTHFRYRKTDPDSVRTAERKLCDEFEKKHGKPPRGVKTRPPKQTDDLFWI